MAEIDRSIDYRERMAACAAAIGIEPPEVVLPEDRWVRLNGLDFHYLDWGNPHLPHVVLLHGGSLTAHTWDMAALLMRQRYHLIALDQRGHGDSGWTPDDQLDRDNSDLMLEDARAFIEHLAAGEGVERLALVGMSMGGINAVRYAARHPQRLDAVVVVDVGPETMREGVIEMEQFRRDTETLERFDDFLERAVAFNPQRKRDHLAYSLTHSLKQTAEGKWTWKQDHRRRELAEASEAEQQRARQRRAEAMWADLRAITTRTLLMRGAESKILAAEHARRVWEAMADAGLVVIPGAGHSVQGDNPKAFAAELDAFLTKVLAARAS